MKLHRLCWLLYQKIVGQDVAESHTRRSHRAVYIIRTTKTCSLYQFNTFLLSGDSIDKVCQVSFAKAYGECFS